MKRKFLSILLALLLLFSSCIKNNEDPSWISVDEWTLLENLNGNPAGELTHNITDAWVFIDNELIGVFEVPFKIPVLKKGNVDIQIYPTILNNGISATKKRYDFLKAYELNTDLVQNDTLFITPTTQYKDNVQFTILDFEDANTGFEDSPSSLANLSTSSDPTIIQPFNGNQFGRVTLTESLFNWISATNLDKDLPRGGAEVYLEVDYHNTADIVTGLLAINSQGTAQNPNVQMNAQDPSSVVWKKIYIELTTIASGSPSAEYFEHTFEAQLPSGVTSAAINIANIKVVHS